MKCYHATIFIVLITVGVLIFFGYFVLSEAESHKEQYRERLEKAGEEILFPYEMNIIHDSFFVKVEDKREGVICYSYRGSLHCLHKRN